MDLEHTHTHAHIDAHVHAHAPSRQVNPGSAGEAHWELWGWTEASLSCSAGGAPPLQHYNPVIITNTLRRLFACMWAYAHACHRGGGGSCLTLSTGASIKREACALLFNSLESCTNRLVRGSARSPALRPLYILATAGVSLAE